MNINEITNENLFHIDWSANDRAKFLRSIPAMKPVKEGWLAPGLSTHGVLGRDVSAMDRRSVKAQLAGRGDLRAAWWNFNEAVHRFFNRDAPLENIMYSFHKRHHAVTLAILTVVHDYLDVLGRVRKEGTLAATRYVFRQSLNNDGLDR
ncbi:MAG TPA: hypothetical protein VJ698_03655 [Noviherbaspirillum sp.]|uniref:hypothetical protein n=1 Tax=Noviherbaspirillum sp. TaxID=1926288 RepID=UPI002B476652|nr:hypothetical protein [Noviherbaspirillum sp.]HJV84546.1 hypothetical protein [Noviherbaspirillum sp.]